MKLLNRIREGIESFKSGWREGRALREAQRREALYVTICDNGHTFNAMYQSGLCPHERVASLYSLPQISAEGQPKNTHKTKTFTWDGGEIKEIH